MSQRALCLGVRDWLHEQFGWNEDQCDVTPMGMPHPAAGEIFVSVHEGGYTNDQYESLNEMHTIYITVTRRVSFSPEDRVSTAAIHEAQMGLDVLVEQVKSRVHMDPQAYAIVHLANGYLQSQFAPGEIVYGFSTPPKFASASRPMPKTASWFSGKDSEGTYAFAVEMAFTNANRLQDIRHQL